MRPGHVRPGRGSPQAGDRNMPGKLLYGQVQRSAMNWPFFAAAELNLFAEQDLIVEARIFTSPPEPVAGLINGSLNVINVIPDVTLVEMVRGASLSLIANTNTRAEYRLLAQPEIKDCGGLKGKQIGVNDGRSAESLILIKLLQAKGLAAGSYELFPAGPPLQRCKKMKQGLIAATMVTEPFHFALEENGFKLLGSSIEVAPHYPFTVCVVRRGERISEEILGFLKSLKKAWKWLCDPLNRESAVAILSRSTDTAEKQAQATYDLYLQPPEPPSLAPTEAGVATVLELLAESGRLPRPLPPARKFIDTRYFERLD